MSADGEPATPLPSGVPKPEIYSATSLKEIRASLAELSARDASITARLDALVASQHDLQHNLNRLDLLRTQLDAQVLTVGSVSNEVLYVPASTAARVTAAVETIDVEQFNIKATLQAVDQVAELRRCIQGTVDSMGTPQDWETAAKYIDRARKIPEEVIDSQYAQEIVPTIEVPDPPSVTLKNASDSLCKLFIREFDDAVQNADGSKITRFFKLFPLIGCSDVGLAAYGKYVCQGVGARARAALSSINANQKPEARSYPAALTKLFEHIAQIVDAHSRLVEKHYGPGMMDPVTEKLQIEADIQGGAILDTWHDEKEISKRLVDVQSYAFTFLVQSFLVPPKLPNGTPRATSPGLPNQGRESESDERALEMGEISRLFNEAGVMLSRWSLYTRFLAQHTQQPDLMPSPDTSSETAPSESPLTMPPFLLNSALHTKVTNLLIVPFNALATFYFRRSLERAFQLDEFPTSLSLSTSPLPTPLSSSPPFITSSVDDTMYIISNILNLTLSTGQLAVLSSVLPTIARILTGDFIGMTQRRMRDECYPRAGISASGAPLPPPEDKTIQFLVLVNSLDLSISYLHRLTEARLNPPPAVNGVPSTPTLESLFPFTNEATRVQTLLSELYTQFSTKGHVLLTDGLAVLFNNVAKPRLRPMILDAFAGVSYSAQTNGFHLDSAADGEDANPDAVLSRFSRDWTALLAPLERIMTPDPYSKLLLSTATHLSRILESRIWAFGYPSSSFPPSTSHSHSSKPKTPQQAEKLTQLGGLRLERDVGRIVDFVSRGGRYAVRREFGRCVEILRVANLERAEWEGMLAEGDKEDGEREEWELSWEARGRARGLVG